MNYATQLEQNKSKWLEAVKKGDSKALELLYRAYRTEFVGWLCAKTNANQEMALDMFQESVLILYKNAKSGRLDTISSSIKTYLFAVGKRNYLYRNRQHKVKAADLELEDLPIEQLIVFPKEGNPMTDRQQLVATLLPKMRPTCRNILYLFYYQNQRLKEIAENLNYKNTNVVKVMKVRCMEALRKLVFQNTKKV